MTTKPWLLEHWRQYQCPECKNGDRSKCTANRKNAKASREEPDGKIHYYCFIGCLMLELDAESRKRFTETQFNVDGHYEKLRNAIEEAQQC